MRVGIKRDMIKQREHHFKGLSERVMSNIVILFKRIISTAQMSVVIIFSNQIIKLTIHFQNVYILFLQNKWPECQQDQNVCLL